MRWALIMSLSLLSSLALATEVYRSVDSQGNVKYSDRPDSTSAVQVVIRTAAAAAPATRPPLTRPEPRGASTAEPDEETAARSVAEQTAADRAANCAAARARSETYETSHRLYRTGADGEREYLTDAQIDEARSAARTEITRWCD